MHVTRIDRRSINASNVELWSEGIFMQSSMQPSRIWRQITCSNLPRNFVSLASFRQQKADEPHARTANAQGLNTEPHFSPWNANPIERSSQSDRSSATLRRIRVAYISPTLLYFEIPFTHYILFIYPCVASFPSVRSVRYLGICFVYVKSGTTLRPSRRTSPS